MSLLGKILLVFNLLAAGGFAYLATQDWKGRQTTTAAGFRHVLLLKGFPLDGKDAFDEEGGVPFVIEMGGSVPTTHVSKALLTSYFASAAGAASPTGPVQLGGTEVVTSQLGEVKRVRGLVEKAAGESANKVGVLAGYLLPMAESYEERAAILAGNENDLAARLSAKFDAVLKPSARLDVTSLAPNPDEKNVANLDARLKAVGETRAGGTADESQRLERIAHLLVHLDRDPAWQKRAMMVVGMRRYVVAVAQQAVRFGEMAARVKRDTEADDLKFVGEYALLRDQAIKNTQLVNDAAANRLRLEAQLTKDQGFVTQRETQLANLKQALARVKADVDELIANQSKIEAVLFEVQREVGLILDEVYKLEADLERKERERFKP
jgi:hypothetical protein